MCQAYGATRATGHRIQRQGLISCLCCSVCCDSNFILLVKKEVLFIRALKLYLRSLASPIFSWSSPPMFPVLSVVANVAHWMVVGTNTRYREGQQQTPILIPNIYTVNLHINLDTPFIPWLYKCKFGHTKKDMDKSTCEGSVSESNIFHLSSLQSPWFLSIWLLSILCAYGIKYFIPFLPRCICSQILHTFMGVIGSCKLQLVTNQARYSFLLVLAHPCPCPLPICWLTTSINIHVKIICLHI